MKWKQSVDKPEIIGLVGNIVYTGIVNNVEYTEEALKDAVLRTLKKMIDGKNIPLVKEFSGPEIGHLENLWYDNASKQVLAEVKLNNDYDIRAEREYESLALSPTLSIEESRSNRNGITSPDVIDFVNIALTDHPLDNQHIFAYKRRKLGKH